MGCWYEWSDESKLIMNVYVEAPWTYEEYDTMSVELTNIFTELKRPCATVVDVSRMGRLPGGNALTHLISTEKMMPPNVFASAIVGAPYVIAGLMDVLMRIRPHAKRTALFARTMAEAHDKIRQKYAKLYPSEQNHS